MPLYVGVTDRQNGSTCKFRVSRKEVYIRFAFANKPKYEGPNADGVDVQNPTYFSVALPLKGEVSEGGEGLKDDVHLLFTAVSPPSFEHFHHNFNFNNLQPQHRFKEIRVSDR